MLIKKFFFGDSNGDCFELPSTLQIILHHHKDSYNPRSAAEDNERNWVSDHTDDNTSVSPLDTNHNCHLENFDFGLHVGYTNIYAAALTRMEQLVSQSNDEE